MRRLAAIALVGTLAVAGLGAAGGSGRALPPGTFAFGIGNGILDGSSAAVADRLGEYDLVVVDGEEAKPADVAALRARGTTVLAYLSVGTIESYRSWYPQLRRYRLAAWEDWRDEWFADVSKPGFRKQIERRIAPSILAKGFDGLFLDNADMIEARRHRHLRAGMRKLVASLADLADAGGGLLFAQNGHQGFRRLGLFDLLDGWNREDVTWTYDFDRKRYVRNPRPAIDQALDELREVAARGLIVTATDYTAPGDAAALAESVANACGAGALPYVSGIGLTAGRLPDLPLACPPPG